MVIEPSTRRDDRCIQRRWVATIDGDKGLVGISLRRCYRSWTLVARGLPEENTAMAG